MLLTNLWTLEDEQDLETLRNAERKDDLLGALFAIEGCTQEERELALQTLASWGRLIQQRLESAPDDPLAAMRSLLVDELHLRGDRDNYYHPHNSHLTIILKRRQGIPILLSAVWMLVGQLANIKLHGVGMPGHFLLRLNTQEDAWIDAFAGGRLLDREACRAVVEQLSQGQLPWDDAFLAPTNMEEMLQRILRNLINAYAQHDDVSGLYRSLRMLSALRPDRLELWLQQGRIAEFIGDFHRALLDYQSYLLHADDHPASIKETDLYTAQKKIAQLKQKQALPN